MFSFLSKMRVDFINNALVFIRKLLFLVGRGVNKVLIVLDCVHVKILRA